MSFTHFFRRGRLTNLRLNILFPKLLFQLTSPWVKCLKSATHLEFESNQTDHIIITNKFQDYHFVFWHQYWLSYFRHLHTFNVSCGCVGMRFVVFCLMFDVGFRVRKFTFRFFYKFIRSVVFAMFTCSYHLWFLVCYDPPMLSQNRIRRNYIKLQQHPLTNTHTFVSTPTKLHLFLERFYFYKFWKFIKVTN